jgi:hypothetical protein
MIIYRYISKWIIGIIMFLPDRLKDNDDTVNILSVIWKKKTIIQNEGVLCMNIE